MEEVVPEAIAAWLEGIEAELHRLQRRVERLEQRLRPPGLPIIQRKPTVKIEVDDGE